MILCFFNSKKGFDVKSYGIGATVKLPGASPTDPNSYPFSTTYEEIYQDLLQKDSQLYPVHSRPVCQQTQLVSFIH